MFRNTDPGVTRTFTVPSQTDDVYEFDAEPYGSHLYHCHSIPLKRHIQKGLYGAFIVDPKEGRPPVQKLHIDRIVLPSQNQIKVHVTNEGPEPVKIEQVLVDDAYWRFDTTNDGPLEPLSSTVVEIPHMWTRGAKHDVMLIMDTGATFGKEIPVALETPKRDAGTLGMFALVGLYVGILPVFLGMLWYPLITRLPAGVYHFVLALTLGLLAYLAVGTWPNLPGSLQRSGRAYHWWCSFPRLYFSV